MLVSVPCSPPAGTSTRPSTTLSDIYRGANREGCVSHFTLRIIIILMETIKDLYQTPTPPAVVGVCTGPKWLSKEAAIASLARMKAEAELASLYRERAIARAWAARRDPKKKSRRFRRLEVSKSKDGWTTH